MEEKESDRNTEEKEILMKRYAQRKKVRKRIRKWQQTVKKKSKNTLRVIRFNLEQKKKKKRKKEKRVIEKDMNWDN